MINKEVINVYRIDYERGEGNKAEIWSAFIAGYSTEEVLSYLGKFYGGKPLKINTVGLECRLDAITEELRAKIKFVPKAKAGRPEGAKTKNVPDVTKYTKVEDDEVPKTKRSIVKK